MRCRNGDGPVLLSLAPVVLVDSVTLDILRLLFVVEYATLDLMVDLVVAELKMWYHIEGKI